jgi:hypothetical protein
MGWRDAPVVEDEVRVKNAWESAPLVEDEPSEKPGYFDRVNTAFESESAANLERQKMSGDNPFANLASTARSLTSAPAIAVGELPGVKPVTQAIGKGLGALSRGYDKIPTPVKMINPLFSLPALVKGGADVAGKVSPSIPQPVKDIAVSGLNVASILPAAKGVRIAEETIPPTLAKTASAYDKTMGKILATTTGVPEDALRKASTKEGRDVLKNAYGKEYEIGQGIVDKIDDAYTAIRSAPKAEEMLSSVPSVNVVPMIQKLRNLAGNPKTAELQAASAKINSKAEELAQIAIENGDAGFIPAKDLYEFRKEIDQIIDDEFGKESGKYVSALKSVRHDIKETLLKAADGTEYASTMQDLAKKFDALDKMKAMVGKNVTTREGRAEGFVRNINNAGKEQQRQWLEDFQNVFGGDYLDKSKNSMLAKKLGEGGEAPWLPQHFTGKSLLGVAAGSAIGTPLVGLAASSPKVASHVILPMTQGISKGLGSINKKLNRVKK